MNIAMTAMRRALVASAMLTAAFVSLPGEAREPETTPVTVPEARALMGYPPSAVNKVLGGLEGSKVAILDLGFDGLEAWLKANPKEAKLTKVIKTLPGNTGTHGYDVYRISRQVLGDAEIYIYDVRAFLNKESELFADMKARGIQFINASFGEEIYPVNRGISAVKRRIAHFHRAVLKEELFTFFSAGNTGAKVHDFEAKAQGFIFTIPDLMVPRPDGKSKVADTLRLVPSRGRIKLAIYWDLDAYPAPPFAIQVSPKDGGSLAYVEGDDKTQRLWVFDKSGNKTEKVTPLSNFGRLDLDLSNLPNEEVHLYLRRLVRDKPQIPMRLYVGLGRVVGNLNGRESALIDTVADNPFIVTVGAISRASDGKAAPSPFSGWGTTIDGGVIPHIHGPGQINLDGKVFQGTSYSAPFVTAMLVAANGYNPKNILERVSDHGRLSPSVPAEERSRWGMPDMTKLFPVNLRPIVGTTKVEDWSHRLDDQGLHVGNTFTRCCMEGMTYNPVIELYRLRDAGGGKTVAERVVDPVTKRGVHVLLTKQTKGKNIEKESLAFTIPKAALPAEPGRYQLRFGFFMKAWRNTLPHRPHEGGIYELSLN